MKKNLVFIIVIFGIIGIGLILFSVNLQSRQSSYNPSPTTTQVTPTSNVTGCEQNQLRIGMESQGAAGSIYGTITVENVSKKSCTLFLGKTISLTTNAGNISSRYQGDAPIEAYLLPASEKVYSQVRIPNGPQCQSGITPKEVTIQYSYENLSIPLQPVTVQACTASADTTIIDIWPLSKTPVSQ